jgi:hypothetical protein
VTILATLLATALAGVDFIPWSEARRVVESIAPEALPEALRGKTAAEREAAWPNWVRARDSAIRERLAQGSADSLAHYMLFGTSFTRAPRLTARELAAHAADPAAVRARVADRIRDLAAALAAPARDERLAFLQAFLRRQGHAPQDSVGLSAFLAHNLLRVLRENDAYARILEAARALDDPSAEFAERSRAFRERGLSSDTSLLPNLAIESSLRELRERGLLPAGCVRRFAVVGPGLDFTDKQDGYDFYPQQSLQPFAVADSLVRLGLSRIEDLEIASLDLNPQVNDHLEKAAAAARAGTGYTIQLPRDASLPWTAEAEAYWARFGDAVGTPANPLAPPPEAGRVRTRAVRVRPELVARLQAFDANVVLQRPSDLGPVDLVIATNVLVYYDTFEQCLALANAAAMLRVGGFLLSNNALLELPGSEMRSVGYRTTAYSDREGDGDHVVWYRKLIVE